MLDTFFTPLLEVVRALLRKGSDALLAHAAARGRRRNPEADNLSLMPLDLSEDVEVGE